MMHDSTMHAESETEKREEWSGKDVIGGRMWLARMLHSQSRLNDDPSGMNECWSERNEQSDEATGEKRPSNQLKHVVGSYTSLAIVTELASPGNEW